MELFVFSRNEKLIIVSVTLAMLLLVSIAGGYAWIKIKEYEVFDHPPPTALVRTHRFLQASVASPFPTSEQSTDVLRHENETIEPSASPKILLAIANVVDVKEFELVVQLNNQTRIVSFLTTPILLEDSTKYQRVTSKDFIANEAVKVRIDEKTGEIISLIKLEEML